MSESVYRVDTTSRLAQWRIETLSSCAYRKSDPFKIGLWNWNLAVERNKQLCVKLYPELSSVTRDLPPIASFVIKIISSSAPNHKTLVHSEVCDKQLKNSDDFVWAIDMFFTGRFLIDLEFLDLKTAPLSGGEPQSIWSGSHNEKLSLSAALTSLSQMLTESIRTDITIRAGDGSISAHRAVLATRSAVFRSMFSHKLQETELSTVIISDMSFETCHVLLKYIYGSFHPEEFIAHRLALLSAADKYDIPDLKEACHDSLLEDIDARNVLERLQVAHLHRLPRLKAGCLRYLVNFGKVYEISEDFNLFLQEADRELIADIFHEILAVWKGF